MQSATAHTFSAQNSKFKDWFHEQNYVATPEQVKKVVGMKCTDCRQPLTDHCDGCCEDAKAGLRVKKFCGKRGNEVSKKTGDNVLELLQRGRISAGKAAELLDKTVYEIQDLLEEKGVSLGATLEQYEKARKTKLPKRRK